MRVVETIQEEWRDVRGFPNYQVSNLGRIYSLRRDCFLSPSFTPFGHMKITLMSPWGREKLTRGVALMVGEAFVEQTHPLCDHILLIDGDRTNVAATNLLWRPRSICWRYSRQLKEEQPLHYQNLVCENVVTGDVYRNIIEAGIAEGLVFSDIWKSTYSGIPLFPNGSIFEIV